MSKPISWGSKARRLTHKDICRGQARSGSKQDLRGWCIEFFGEHTRAAIAFEQYLSNLVNNPVEGLENWSNNVTIREQVKVFNRTLKDLKVFGTPHLYTFHKRFKNGKVAKKELFRTIQKNDSEAWNVFLEEFDEYTKSQILLKSHL